ELLVRSEDIDTGYMVAEWLVPGFLHPDIPVIQVISAMLSDKRSGFLSELMKEEYGLAAAMEVEIDMYMYQGSYSVHVNLDDKPYEKARDVLFSGIKSLIEKGIDDKELEKLKKRIITRRLFAYEDTENPASSLSFFSHVGYPELSNIYIKELSEITSADIVRVAAKYFSKNKTTLTAFIPGEAVAGTQYGFSEESPEYYDDVDNKHARKWASRQQREIDALRESALFSDKEKDKRKLPEKIVMKNGITLLISQDNSRPTVSMNAFFKGGLKLETEKNNGIGTLTIDMITRGTGKMSHKEILDAVSEKGGIFTNYSAPDYNRLMLNISSEDTLFGIELLADMIMDPVFDKNQLKKVRSTILEEIYDERSKGDLLHGLMIHKYALEAHPYSMSLVGTEDSINSISRSDIAKYYTAHIKRGENLVFSISGDVDTNMIISSIEEQFAGIPSRGSPSSEVTAVSRLWGGVKHGLIEMSDSNEAIFSITFPAVPIEDKRASVFMILEDILGNPLTGRIFRAVRRKGLAYDVFSEYNDFFESGIFTTYVESEPQYLKELSAIIWKEYEGIYQYGITERKLQAAKENVVGRVKSNRQTNEAYAYDIALNEMDGRGYDNYINFEEQIYAVTLDDIIKVVQEYFLPDHHVLVVTADENSDFEITDPPDYTKSTGFINRYLLSVLGILSIGLLVYPFMSLSLPEYADMAAGLTDETLFLFAGISFFNSDQREKILNGVLTGLEWIIKPVFALKGLIKRIKPEDKTGKQLQKSMLWGNAFAVTDEFEPYKPESKSIVSGILKIFRRIFRIAEPARPLSIEGIFDGGKGNMAYQLTRGLFEDDRMRIRAMNNFRKRLDNMEKKEINELRSNLILLVGSLEQEKPTALEKEFRYQLENMLRPAGITLSLFEKQTMVIHLADKGRLAKGKVAAVQDTESDKIHVHYNSILKAAETARDTIRKRAQFSKESSFKIIAFLKNVITDIRDYAKDDMVEYLKERFPSITKIFFGLLAIVTILALPLRAGLALDTLIRISDPESVRSESGGYFIDDYGVSSFIGQQYG
ncbi:M16 family metallopeptidase, partial [Elusimicrobiota bacterium]